MFEGKPPELKRAELAKRSTKKEEATTELEAAKEVGGREGNAGGPRAWGVGRGVASICWWLCYALVCCPAAASFPGTSQAGNQEDVEKYSKRAVKVTRQHNEECKQLLRLMVRARCGRGLKGVAQGGAPRGLSMWPC